MTVHRAALRTIHGQRERQERSIAEILRGVEPLGAKARGLNLHTLSFLLDMAKLEAIRLSHREEGSGR